jgi:hypothetical protein
LTPRQRDILALAHQAEAYQRQERRKAHDTPADAGDRPDHFGDVGESRRSAFQ